MDYRLFQSSYTDKPSGQRRKSDTWHIAFRDHLNRRQTLAASVRERDAHALAGRIMELVRCRKGAEPVGDKLQKWLDAQPVKLLKRLCEMEVIDPRTDAGKLLLRHLDGWFDAEGVLAEPGFKQALEARGNTANHVKVTTDRVRRILEACAFNTWRDISAPGAATLVEVFLGNLRAQDKISGQTMNYYIRDAQSFCRWLDKQNKVPAMALGTLSPVKNAQADSELRRPLSVDEVKLLLAAAVEGIEVQCMSGADRAMLYRFAFETGMRPGQIRTLTPQNFNLDADPPTVTTGAMYVKRRRVHVQTLRPAMAGELRTLFTSKMPTAPAIKMPTKYHLADMLRHDLAIARAKWIALAANDKDREERQRSDFLAAVNHQGERAVFYSIRHGHGTALANAGVPEKDIAASMHHASRKTTERYIHADRASVSRAIDAMPDLAYQLPKSVTGTMGATDSDSLRNACATGTSPIDSGGQSDSSAVDSGIIEIASKTSEKGGIAAGSTERPLGGIGRRDGFKIHCTPCENPNKSSVFEPGVNSLRNPHAITASAGRYFTFGNRVHSRTPRATRNIQSSQVRERVRSLIG